MISRLSIIGLAWVLLSLPVNAQQPAIEYSSLLDAVTVKFQNRTGNGATGGTLVVNQTHQAVGVFFPQPDNWKANEPGASGGHRLDMALYRLGSTQALVKYPCDVRKSGTSVFSFINIRQTGQDFEFKEEGDYVLSFLLDNQPITSLTFNVFFKKKSDDAFDTSKYTFADGDWSELAYLHYSADKDVSPLEFFTWTRKIVFSTTPEPSSMDVTLLRGDEVVAVTPRGTIAWPEWQKRQLSFKFPENQGGQFFNNTDLLKQDGKYTVRVDVDEKPHQYFNFEVRSNKIVPHSQQVMGYEPRTEWLSPRRIRLGLDGTGHVFWMDRADSPVVESRPEMAGPSPESKAKWVAKSSVDPNQPFQLTHTNILMRKDNPFSIGDGIVAYATGSSTGVGYFNVGENKPKSIPKGQSFRADTFHAAGKLILMTTRNGVSVHSTENGRSVDIPNDEVFLSYQKGGLYGPRYVHGDGFLVATVNEPAKLKSKSIINVIDLSGDNRPRVIPIKNSDFELRHVTSIRVNAAAGKVAVGCKAKGAIYVADVVPNARFKKYDVSGFDSFGEADMVLTESHIVYTDAAGFANMRILDLKTGDVRMPTAHQYGAGWGPVAASNGREVAWPVKEPSNSWVVGDLNGDPVSFGNTNEKDANGFRLGTGRSLAMTPDGTVFLAGTKGISSRYALQVGQDGTWNLVTDADGKPIHAIDVVASDNMLVFRTGEPSTSSQVKISYAVFGDTVDISKSPMVQVSQTKQTEATSEKSPADSEAMKETAKNSTKPVTEIDLAFLKDVRENEETIANALKTAFGEEEAKRRAREAGVNTLKSAGREHLIEMYKQGWK